MGNIIAQNMAKKIMMNQLENCKDEELIEKLIPKEPAGCKRIAISRDWLPMMLRDNVELITEKIDHIQSNGVVVANSKTGEKRLLEADVIIYATGFHSNSFLEHIDIGTQESSESERKTLIDFWDGVPAAYKGITVPEFPNMFITYGPNTNLGHSSIIFMVECQVNYIMKILTYMIDHKYSTVEVKSDIYHEYNQEMNDRLDKLVWSGRCSSWYKKTTKDGKTRIVNNWCGTTLEYYLRTLNLNPSDYHFSPK